MMFHRLDVLNEFLNTIFSICGGFVVNWCHHKSRSICTCLWHNKHTHIHEMLFEILCVYGYETEKGKG
jgi:hypothetical protein